MSDRTVHIKILFDDAGAVKSVDRLDAGFQRATGDARKLATAHREAGETGQRAFTGVNGVLGTMGRTVGSVFNAVMSLKGLLVGFLAGAAIGLIKWITAPAIAAAESENLFTVSMGKMADAARIWSVAMSKATGINEYEIRKNIGTFNVMFSAMGLGAQKSFEMAKGLTQLAYDFASFYDMRPDEAFEKLRSGISGEIEPLRRLGIVVDEETVKQYAYKTGIAVVGQELTQLQKIQSRYLVIMEQSKAAQGDLIRTSDSAANQIRRLQSQYEQLKIVIGNLLIPVLTQFLIKLNAVLEKMDAATVTGFIRGIYELVTGFNALTFAVGATAAAFAGMGIAAMVPSFVALWSIIKNMSDTTIFAGLGGWIKNFTHWGEAIGVTAARLGTLGTAATIFGAALAGWYIGRKIAEITGLDEALQKLYSHIDWSKLPWWLGGIEGKAKAGTGPFDISEEAIARIRESLGMIKHIEIATNAATPAVHALSVEAQKLVASFIEQNTITPDIAAAIHQLHDSGVPASELYEKWGKNLSSWNTQADESIKRLLIMGHLQQIQEKGGKVPLVGAPLPGYSELQTLMNARAQIPGQTVEPVGAPLNTEVFQNQAEFYLGQLERLAGAAEQRMDDFQWNVTNGFRYLAENIANIFSTQMVNVMFDPLVRGANKAFAGLKAGWNALKDFLSTEEGASQLGALFGSVMSQLVQDIVSGSGEALRNLSSFVGQVLIMFGTMLMQMGGAMLAVSIFLPLVSAAFGITAGGAAAVMAIGAGLVALGTVLGGSASRSGASVGGGGGSYGSATSQPVTLYGSIGAVSSGQGMAIGGGGNAVLVQVLARNSAAMERNAEVLDRLDSAPEGVVVKKGIVQAGGVARLMNSSDKKAVTTMVFNASPA